MSIEYKINSATKAQISDHLEACNNRFSPVLSSRVDLNLFSKKIFNNSVIIEAWDKKVLIGMVSAYFNDINLRAGYINNVSVLQEYSRKGVASVLLSKCIRYGEDNNFLEIILEVSNSNTIALKLYEKFGFNTFKTSKQSKYLKYEIMTNGEGF